MKKLTITGGGTINGHGKAWWNKWVLDPPDKKRPKLVNIGASTDVLVEKMHFVDSPSFHLQLTDVLHAEISNSHVRVDRDEIRSLKAVMSQRRHDLGDKPSALGVLEPEDLNTDGFDLSGRDIWVHDCNIVNDDDSIAVRSRTPPHE